MNKLFSNVVSRILDYIHDNHISISRSEDIGKYLTQLTRMSYGLTLHPNEGNLEDILFLKTIYAVWNIIVDDETDIHGFRSKLDDSINLLEFEDQEATTDAGRIIKDIFNKDKYLNSKCEKMVKQNFKTVMDGCNYEFLINTNQAPISSASYDAYSVNTISILPFLDIEMLYGKKLESKEYQDIKRACLSLAKAMKYASDIGSLRREIDIEKNLNIILIKAIEDCRITKEDVLLQRISYDTFITSNKDILQDIEQQAGKYLEEGTTMLKNVQGLDTGLIINTVTSIVSSYLKGDSFNEIATI